MKTFFKFVVYSFFLAIMVIGTWGYYRGFKVEDYKSLLTELTTMFKDDSDETPSPVPSKKSKRLNLSNQGKQNQSANKGYSLQPLPSNPFKSIDSKARNCSSKSENNIDSLANYLASISNNDIEKARAIYIWLTDNIRYDDYAYNNNLESKTAEEVLADRKAVCDGFSSLFLVLGEKMGLEIRKVAGYAKGYGYVPNEQFNDTDHAWNIIKINGVWRIFDATWGQGYGENVKNKLVSKKKFDDYWFDVSPVEAIFNHLPEDADCLLSACPSKRDFEKMPYIEPALFNLGFDGKAVYKAVNSSKKISFPDAYNIGTYVSVEVIPLEKMLVLNKPYLFEIEVPRAYEVALIDANDNWTSFERENGMFKLNYKPTVAGLIQISVRHEKSGESFETVLVYQAGEERNI
ncbi:MAG: hypothetical protein IT258_22395 [Saprospiraceae bacterium]|nr:hypothetical protein [Saprospiraceae bacterium]